LITDEVAENAAISWSANATLALMSLVNANKAASVVTSLVSWVTIYVAMRASLPSKSPEWHCRCVTFLHAAVVVSLSACSAFVEGPWPFTDPAGPNTLLQVVTCAISMGYFMFDFGWCLYFRSEGAVMLFHHLLSIAGNGVVLHRQINGTEMMAAFFGTEITNPLLQLRWFIRYEKLGERWPVVKELVDFSFFILFTVMRIGIASVLLYYYLLHPRPDWIARCFSITLYAVGWIFWISVMKFGIRKCRWMLFGNSKENSAAKVNGTTNGVAHVKA
jgi:hypothetical protein